MQRLKGCHGPYAKVSQNEITNKTLYNYNQAFYLKLDRFIKLFRCLRCKFFILHNERILKAKITIRKITSSSGLKKKKEDAIEGNNARVLTFCYALTDFSIDKTCK